MQPPNDAFSPPEILTENLRLRGHTLDDFENSAAMWADSRVVAHISGKPFTRSQSWARLLRHAGHWLLLGYGYWLVEDRKTGDFMGAVGFARQKRGIDPVIEDLPEIGWVLVPEVWGRGVASEAVAGVVEWGDKNLPVAKTYCIFDPSHGASIRIAQKNGFRKLMDGSYDGKPTLIMLRDRDADRLPKI